MTSDQLSDAITKYMKIQPPQVIPEADSLEKYVKAAEHDGIVQIEFRPSRTSQLTPYISLTPAWLFPDTPIAFKVVPGKPSSWSEMKGFQ